MKFLVLTLLFISSLSVADDKLKDVLSVMGLCNIDILPDRVSVSFTIEELDMNQKNSTDKASKKYNALLSKIKALKLKNAEYQTTEYSVFPHRPWENRKQVFKGYKTRISFKVTTSEMDKTGNVLTLGDNLEQDSVRGPDSFVSDELFKKNYLACLKTAMNDAFEKAAILASSSKRKLGKVIAVHEGQGGDSRPMPMLKAMRAASPMMAMDASAPPQIEFGKDKIHVRLNVYFEMD